MNAAVLLYTMKCNVSCGHCSVDSHPKRTEKMSVERGQALITGLAQVPEVEFIDVTGGEPMLYIEEMETLATTAATLGKAMRIVSNGFWAKSPTSARAVLTRLRDCGVQSVGLSIDEWHLDFLKPEIVPNYIGAAREIGMTPLLSCVIRGASSSAGDHPLPTEAAALVRRYGIDPAQCIPSGTWRELRAAAERSGLAAVARFDQESADRFVVLGWQFLAAEGRARRLPVISRPLVGSPLERCDAAGRMPTIDDEGNLFPCCSPWVSRKGHAISTVTGPDLPEAVRAMRREPLVRVLHTLGPKLLIEAAARRGIDMPTHHSGICNQCGMLLDRLSLPELRALAAELWTAHEHTFALWTLGLESTDHTANAG